MKFRVGEQCIGCGLCSILCPAVFRITEHGYAEAIPEEIAEEDLSDAGTAMNSCPSGAIKQTD